MHLTSAESHLMVLQSLFQIVKIRTVCIPF